MGAKLSIGERGRFFARANLGIGFFDVRGANLCIRRDPSLGGYWSTDTKEFFNRTVRTLQDDSSCGMGGHVVVDFEVFDFERKDWDFRSSRV